MGRVSKFKGPAPSPKVKGIIRQSNTWHNAVDLLARNQEVTVSLPKEFLKQEGIANPVNSFKVALQRHVNRKYGGKFRVYVVGGIIYAVKKVVDK